MFDHSWRMLSAVGSVALLPLVITLGNENDASVAIRVAAAPVAIGLTIATVTRPMDLTALSPDDFGDTDGSIH